MPSKKKHSDADFSVQKKQKGKKSRSILATGFLFLFIATAIFSVGGVFVLKSVAKSLPTTDQILSHEPSLATIVYDRNQKIVTRLFEENRTWVKFDKISPWMIKAILAAEDSDFYDHNGIKITSIVRAGIVDLFHLGAKQGGSTITQQLARNLFLTNEKTIIRKVKEAVLAMRIEKIYSKDQLLEMYLNTIYMGHGAYGIDSAAKTYFGKQPEELTITESAIIAGIVAAPEAYTPFRNPDRAKSRKEYVLGRMLDLDWISKADYDKSIAETPKLAERIPRNSTLFLKDAPHFISHVLFKQLLPAYGTDQVYRGGLRIYTTIDIDLQKKAEELIAGMKHEGALVALDPDTGEILALVGGRDFDSSKFNRATQAFRQPGSSFKPFVYAAALELGYRPIDHVIDAPLHFPNGWSPRNYSSNQFFGEVTLIDALAKSINTVAVRLAQIDGVAKIIDLARRVGISTQHMPEDLSLALGTPSVTPLEMAVAYSAFANNGYKVEPYGIREVQASNGDSLEQSGPRLADAISPTTAVTMRSMLIQAATWGTGAKAKIAGYETFGKTGTTNDWTDAWFAGGVPGLVVIVYVGNDDHKPLGGRQTGTVAAVPIWHEFVKFAVTKLNLRKTFVVPPDAGVESITVCRDTGFLAAPGCKTADILVPSDQVPTSTCPWHGGDHASAKADSNAPALLLAPIDDESTRARYAMTLGGGADDTPGTVDIPDVEPPLSPVVVKKTPGKDSAKVPAAKEEQPYKVDYSNPKALEKAYQDLLKQYKLID